MSEVDTNKKLSMEEFCEAVKAKVKEELPDKDVKYVHLNKTHYTTNSITVGYPDDDNHVSIAVHVGDFYDNYLHGLDTIDSVADIVIKNFKNDHINAVDIIASMKSWETVKPRIIGRLLNYKRCANYLVDKLYKRVGDTGLVVSYAIDLDKHFIAIKEDYLIQWVKATYDVDQAFHENMERNGYVLMDIDDAARDAVAKLTDEQLSNSNIGEVPYIDRTPESRIMLVTSANGSNGAVNILNPKVHEELDEIYGSYGYYCIPSSVHEFIVYSGICDVNELKAMVEDVNSRVVNPDEVLDDNIYIWSDGELKAVF